MTAMVLRRPVRAAGSDGGAGLFSEVLFMRISFHFRPYTAAIDL